MANKNTAVKLVPIEGSEEERYVSLFVYHLFNLLPLYNTSNSDEKNLVIKYCVKYLTGLKRSVVVDKHFNIISDAKGKRAMVAHTDSIPGGIDDNKHSGLSLMPYQKIRYSQRTGLIINESNIRPMGGDDKVGVAAALAMAEICPDIVIWLPANEEVGCKGSNAIEPGKVVDIAIQLDRRGSSDLIDSIGGKIAHHKTVKAVLDLILSKRSSMGGSSTDVAVLVEHKHAKCAFNMSCGYFKPHTSDEYIDLNLAIIAAIDGYRILRLLPDDLCIDIRNERYSSYNNNRENNHTFFEGTRHNVIENDGFEPFTYSGVGRLAKSKQFKATYVENFLDYCDHTFADVFRDTSIKAYSLLRQFHTAFEGIDGGEVRIIPIGVLCPYVGSPEDGSGTLMLVENKVMTPEELNAIDVNDPKIPIRISINHEYKCDWCKQSCSSGNGALIPRKEGKPAIICMECWKGCGDFALATFSEQIKK